MVPYVSIRPIRKFASYHLVWKVKKGTLGKKFQILLKS